MKAIRILLPVIVIAAVSIILSFSVAAAQGEPPPPYAGLENPFPWDDTSAHNTGKAIYNQLCLGCHGLQGSNLADADFSSSEYQAHLETRPDYFYWILSEGNKDEGMPAYSSSLSEEERWQVLTYVWSLGSGITEEIKTAPVIEDGILRLNIPDKAVAGESITITATLIDDQGNRVANAPVEFFMHVDFFASGLAKIGEALTGSNGQAEINYTPKITGEVPFVARYQKIEKIATILLSSDDGIFYTPEVGIHVPVLGEEVFIGPPERLKLGTGGNAPPPVLRLPTGHLAWLTPLIFAAMCVWIVYSFVVYQVVRIPEWEETEEIDTRRVPRLILAAVCIMGLLLMMMLILGPESNPHLLP